MTTTEPATIHRYLADDEDRFGIPKGALVLCTPTDYDDDKATVVAVLPGMHDPECSTYLCDLGPTLAEAEVTLREEAPWGFRLADGYDPASLVAAAESQERADAELMGRPEVASAVRTLYDACVTCEQIQIAYKAIAAQAGE